MISPDYVRLMAAYTKWQNINIYESADKLTDAERKLERGAFFGSIHATLNHVLWGDRLWMHRLAGTSKPAQAGIPDSTSAYGEWQALKMVRDETDAELIDWSGRVSEEDLTGEFCWRPGGTETTVCRPNWTLVIQLFNHSTHHRGQVHAMLTAAGVKPGDTDVQYLESEHLNWDDF
jgi:uncharacterized damage-inducible protein DinB